MRYMTWNLNSHSTLSSLSSPQYSILLPKYCCLGFCLVYSPMHQVPLVSFLLFLLLHHQYWGFLLFCVDHQNKKFLFEVASIYPLHIWIHVLAWVYLTKGLLNQACFIIFLNFATIRVKPRGPIDNYPCTPVFKMS